MKTLILVALLCAATVNAQSLISLCPTSHVATFKTECNTGKWFPSWECSTLTTITLSNRVLTFSHTLHSQGVPYWGTAIGGPKRLIDTFRYRQIGAATYWPLGGEQITVYAETKSGVVAGTNLVMESDMHEIWWLPEFVGECVIGDSLQRTTTTGSALVMSGRNLLGQPYLLQIKCSGGGSEFLFERRFEQNERKQITLEAGLAGVDWLVFDLDDAGGWAL